MPVSNLHNSDSILCQWMTPASPPQQLFTTDILLQVDTQGSYRACLNSPSFHLILIFYFSERIVQDTFCFVLWKACADVKSLDPSERRILQTEGQYYANCLFPYNKRVASIIMEEFTWLITWRKQKNVLKTNVSYLINSWLHQWKAQNVHFTFKGDIVRYTWFVRRKHVPHTNVDWAISYRQSGLSTMFKFFRKSVFRQLTTQPTHFDTNR